MGKCVGKYASVHRSFHFLGNTRSFGSKRGGMTIKAYKKVKPTLANLHIYGPKYVLCLNSDSFAFQSCELSAVFQVHEIRLQTEIQVYIHKNLYKVLTKLKMPFSE